MFCGVPGCSRLQERLRRPVFPVRGAGQQRFRHPGQHNSALHTAHLLQGSVACLTNSWRQKAAGTAGAAASQSRTSAQPCSPSLARDFYSISNGFPVICDLQAAHAVLQLQDTGKPVYKVKNVSLNALCELYNAPVNPMKEQVRIVWSKALMEIF